MKIERAVLNKNMPEDIKDRNRRVVYVFQAVGLVLFIVGAFFVMYGFFMCKVSNPKIFRTLFEPDGEPGAEYENKWENSYTTLEVIFWILFGLGAMGVGMATFISRNPFANGVVLIVSLILFIVIGGLLIFMLPWNILNVNKFIGNTYQNAANDLLYCCHPEAYSKKDIGCPNYSEDVNGTVTSTPCTAAPGSWFNGPEENWPELEMDGHFIFRIVALLLFEVAYAVTILMSGIALFMTRAEASEVLGDIDILLKSLETTGASPYRTKRGRTNFKSKKFRKDSRRRRKKRVF